MARFGGQVPENYGDGGEAADESGFDAEAAVHSERTTADQIAAHLDSVPAQRGVGTTRSSISSLRRRKRSKVMGITSNQCHRSSIFQGGVRVEEDSLKEEVKELSRTLEMLQEAVQVQTMEIGDLEEQIKWQAKKIESQSKQIELQAQQFEWLQKTVDDLKDLVSHCSSGSQHKEPLVGSVAGSGRQEDGTSATNNPGSSRGQPKNITTGLVETETGTSPPDYQEDDRIRSMEVSPFGTTLLEAAVQNNPEQLVENGRKETSADSNSTDDARRPSSYPSDQGQVQSRVSVSADNAESRILVQRPQIRDCYVSLQRVDPVLTSMRKGLSVPATSTNQDEKNSSSAEDSDGSHEEEKTLKRRRYNYDHIQVVGTNPTLYQCEFCLQKFKSRACRSRHDMCKNGLKNVRYKCKECSLGFTQKGGYDSHIMRRHSNERPFACPQCHRRFKAKSDVTQHVKFVHLRKRPLSCPHCSKTFATRRDLESHVRKHTGVKPYLCEKCSRTFKDNSTLATHLRRAHGSENV